MPVPDDAAVADGARALEADDAGPGPDQHSTAEPVGGLGAPPPADATGKGADAAAPPALDAGVAGPDGPPAACRARFCEDFESVAMGAPPDPKIWNRSGNILVEAAPGGRGGKAMHVRAGQIPTETYISQTTTLPALGGAFYARVFMYIGARPTEFFHWSFTEVRGPDLRGTTVRFGGISVGGCLPGMFCRDSFFFQIKPLVYGADEGGSASDDMTALIAEKTWQCVEWYLDAATREARLWWNGQERPRAHYLDSRAIPFPALTRFYLGWALYQTGSSGGWETWFDDLAVNDQRIGCGR